MPKLKDLEPISASYEDGVAFFIYGKGGAPILALSFDLDSGGRQEFGNHIKFAHYRAGQLRHKFAVIETELPDIEPVIVWEDAVQGLSLPWSPAEIAKAASSNIANGLAKDLLIAALDQYRSGVPTAENPSYSPITELMTALSAFAEQDCFMRTLRESDEDRESVIQWLVSHRDLKAIFFRIYEAFNPISGICHTDQGPGRTGGCELRMVRQTISGQPASRPVSAHQKIAATRKLLDFYRGLIKVGVITSDVANQELSCLSLSLS